MERPRIVSEVKKTLPNRTIGPVITRMTGALLWKVGLSEWHLVQAEIRQGRLALRSQPKVYFPLQRLNLEAAEQPRTFTLTKHNGYLLATFQTLTDADYEAWVKALAVDILRQTPLHDVRFLDIIGITRKKHYHNTHQNKQERTQFFAKNGPNCDYSFVNTTDYDIRNMKIRRAQKLRPKLPFSTWNRTQSLENFAQCNDYILKDVSDESGIGSGDENNNQKSHNKNHSSDKTTTTTFVSVRDKKQFFESLTAQTKNIRSLSMVDLKSPQKVVVEKQEKTPGSQQVQQMRQLFEKAKTMTLKRSVSMISSSTDSVQAPLSKTLSAPMNDDSDVLLTQRRLQRGERKLSKLRIQMVEVEDTIKEIADRILTIRPNTFKRREGLEILTTLKRRLEEENSRLDRLQEETVKVAEENKTLYRNLTKT